jgi:hypothetical protein
MPTPKTPIYEEPSGPIATEEVAKEFLSQLATNLEDLARYEAVDHPSHYNSGAIEVIDAIEDWNLDFNAGNVVKYVARHEHKANPIEDLKKARWYLDRLISNYEQHKEQTP